MVRSSRRMLLVTALAILAAVVSVGQLRFGETPARAAYDPSGPAWDPLSTFDTSSNPGPVFQPPKLLAGTNSHALPASAAKRNGYCLDVNVPGVTAAAIGTLGFVITAKDPIDSSSPPTVNVPVPASGTYAYGPVGPAAGADYFDGGTPSNTADDVYCVVAYAPPGYRTLSIAWHWEGTASVPNPIVLPDISIVTVTLDKVGDGIVGGPAEVCTTGWDSTFLTGATSNPVSGVNSPVIPNGLADPPDPVNVVTPSDFTIVPGFSGTTPTVAYVRQVGPEWCAGIDAPGNSSNIQVQFNFHAIYNRVDIGSPTVAIDKDGDDQPASLQLPANRLVKITQVVELRHVTIDGRTPPRPLSGPLALGFTHYVCLIGTVAADSLLASNIVFSPIGGPDVPGATGVTVFHKSAANEPRIGSQVPNGTLCFSYTSNAPGQHTIAAYFNNSAAGGALTAAFFDTDGDGNGIVSPGPASPLIARWVRIDRTEITTGGSPTAGRVTFGTIEIPLRFNVADGTFLASANLTEWVIGSFNSGSPQTTNLLVDGARLEMRIIGCGYFQVPNTALKPATVTGISVGGRFELNDGSQDPFAPAFGDTDANPDDIRISTTNATNCGPSAVTRLEIDVFYPNQAAPAAPTENVTIRYVFFPGQKDIRVAWAGQVVTLTYAFASTTSCAGQTVRFTRPSDQPGAFLPAPGVTINGPGSASADFGANCSVTVRYESESPGEVDIEVFIDGRPWTKIAFVIYYLVFEDIRIDATPDQFVSTLGGVTANVRGYFVGSNPSGRPAETKPDGRTVPADRWVLPDDWAKLRGDPNFRSDPPEMPAAIVTFMMQNEPVRNSYKPLVTGGSSGFFVPDDQTDFSPNVNPHTKAPTVLGSAAKPRMYSQPSDGQGQATIATYGDFNLTFEECPANRITGNPHCEPEQIVGRGRYIAVAEYPEPTTRGKNPAVASNVAETVWRWAGYKRVTVVNGESPQFKYVVAHLKDRDGFCDAANYNNVLGIPIRFEIDAGSGVILNAADQPADINGTRRFATATTFDTVDPLGNPINVAIAKPVIQNDECQAWLRVSNSLMKPANVMVTFPALPAPIPGNVTISAFSCTGQESITVTNRGSAPVNLAGFGLQSPGGQVGIAEHLDLSGLLQPGQSATFYGGPGASARGWIGNTGDRILGAGDYVALTWNDIVLATAFCSTGQVVEPFIPPVLTLDPEGELVLDVIVPFGDEVEVSLAGGWNLVPTGQGKVAVGSALGDNAAKVAVIYAWDAEKQEWLRYIPGAPDAVNTLTELGGRAVWVYVNEPFTLVLPR